jgi:L-threonylcarbamoyladenylate synthase
METLVITPEFIPVPDNKHAVSEAVRLLLAGEVVALPTETVYGLAADALNPLAVAKIFEAKERPTFDPLIVHLPHKKDLDTVAEVPEELQALIQQITDAFWPGPLTLVLPKKAVVPDLVTAGQPTVAVRVSSHSLFRKVAQQLGRPIAAPSANRFGSISPTSAAAVISELDGRIPLIIDGGATMHGLESTIIKVEPGKPKAIITILRPGPVTVEDLKPFGKVRVLSRSLVDEASEAPGQLASHYAPRTPLRLLASPEDFVPQPGKRYALLSYRGEPKDGYVGLTDWEEVMMLSPGKGKLPEAAVRFFYMLRQLDALGVDEIIAEPLAEHGVGLAMMDRLRRASVKAGANPEASPQTEATAAPAKALSFYKFARYFDPQADGERKVLNAAHWSPEDAFYFVTFWLTDALSDGAQKSWTEGRAAFVAEHAEPWDGASNEIFNRSLCQDLQQALDVDHGQCLLTDPEVAERVQAALEHFHGDRYALIAHAIQSNHVHLLVKMIGKQRIEKTLEGWLSYTAHEINKHRGSTDPVWAEDALIHLVRGERSVAAVQRYIREAADEDFIP